MTSEFNDHILQGASDARLVFVGEASHGVQEFTDFKTGLLAATSGTTRPVVVVLEAGHLEVSTIPDYTASGDMDGAVRAVFPAIFQTTAWRNLLTVLSRARPSVSIYGMDCRVKGLADTPISRLLDAVSPALKDRFVAAERDMKVFNATGVVRSGTDTDAFLAARDRLTCLYEDCLSAIPEKTIAGGIVPHRVFRQRLGLLGVLDNLDAYFAFRERAMADTLRWIDATEDPDAQIFVLTHNEHARKNIDVDDEGDSIVTLLANDDISMYSIGVYGHAGSMMQNNGQVITVPPPDETLLEHRAFEGRTDDAIALSMLAKDVATTRTRIREFCFSPISLIPSARFDTIVFLRHLHPPILLART